MKKAFAFVVAGLLILGAAAVPVSAEDDVRKMPSCRYCGMDREKFAHSRVSIEYDDGTSVGTCSIHCAAMDLVLNIDKTPNAVLVGDYNARKLIDAEKAVWVIGGNKQGVMTKRAKWAFETREAAEAFVKENGGTIAAYDDALKAAYEDMHNDTRMIREKRKMMKKTAGHSHK